MPVETISGLPDNVVGVIAKGKVRGEDYEDVIDPAVDAALANHDKVRFLYVLGADFDGYTGDASWEDGKLGMKHITSWEKIAFVSDKDWIRNSVNVMGYLIPGKVKSFSLDDEADARAWILT